MATKKGQSREKAADFQEMGTLRCDSWGEEFFLSHEAGFADKVIAEKQALWFEHVLPKSTTAIRNTPTESNCQTDLHEPVQGPDHGSKINRTIHEIATGSLPG